MGHWSVAKIKDFAEVKGGKRLPKGKQLIKESNSHPYIRIRDLGKTKYIQLNSEYEQDISIFYPSIKEQERIVNILSSVDEKIEMNNAINNNLAA